MILHKTILTYRREYELCCNIAVYIYIENRLFSPLLACFSIFVVVFGGFQFASEFTIVTVIVCFPGGLCFGETEATLCVSFVTFCDYITYNYHYWLEFLNFDIDTVIHWQKILNISAKQAFNPTSVGKPHSPVMVGGGGLLDPLC